MWDWDGLDRWDGNLCMSCTSTMCTALQCKKLSSPELLLVITTTDLSGYLLMNSLRKPGLEDAAKDPNKRGEVKANLASSILQCHSETAQPTLLL